MLVKSVAAKLKKAGWVIEQRDNQFRARKPGNRYLIEWFRNGGTEDAVCLSTRKENDISDLQSDYHAGCFADSIAQAIARAERWDAMDKVNDMELTATTTAAIH